MAGCPGRQTSLPPTGREMDGQGEAGIITLYAHRSIIITKQRSMEARGGIPQVIMYSKKASQTS